MLQLINISKTFSAGTPRELAVLSGVNLQVRNGDFVVLLGSNGSGKSTLVRLIAGEVQPDTGEIHLNGDNITHLPAYLRSHSIARVHQSREHNLVSTLTITEILSLALSVKKHPMSLMLKHQWQDKIRSLLESVKPELCKRLDEQLSTLSGGEHQVITILAAIELILSSSSSGKLILLDEHVAHLDPPSSKTVMALTTALVEKHNLTTLMVTHNLQIATQYGNRVLILKDRQIVFDKQYSAGEQRDPKELYDIMVS